VTCTPWCSGFLSVPGKRLSWCLSCVQNSSKQIPEHMCPKWDYCRFPLYPFQWIIHASLCHSMYDLSNWHLVKLIGLGRFIARAVSRRLPTAAARVRERVRSCGICGGQSGTAAGFLRVLNFPLPSIPPIAPHSSSSIHHHAGLVQ
jgi:hypothetical protein